LHRIEAEVCGQHVGQPPGRHPATRPFGPAVLHLELELKRYLRLITSAFGFRGRLKHK
jgi:hypothetical protein